MSNMISIGTSANNFHTDSAAKMSALSGGNRRRTNFDSNETFHFTDELTKFDPKIFDTLHEELSFLRIFPTNLSIDAGLEALGYIMEDGNAIAKPMAKNSTDFPKAEVTSKRFLSRFVNLGCYYEFTEQDILASGVAKRNIVDRLKKQVFRANMECMNIMSFFGNAEHEINGLFSDVNITNKATVVKSKEASKQTMWKGKTNEEVLEDIVSTRNDVREKTKHLISPDTLLISPSGFDEISTRVINKFSSATILTHVENTLRVNVEIVPELADVKKDDKGCFVLFKKDERYIEQLIPTMYRSTEPHRVFDVYQSALISRYGGLVIRQPKMFAIRYGI